MGVWGARAFSLTEAKASVTQAESRNKLYKQKVEQVFRLTVSCCPNKGVKIWYYGDRSMGEMGCESYKGIANVSGVIQMLHQTIIVKKG